MSRNSADSKTIDELFGACRRGQKENLSIILESLGDDQQESVWEALRQTTIPGFPRSWRFTLLIEASGLGHFAVVEELLKQGAQVDKRGSNNYTPLIAGAFEGHKEVVSFLLQHGADINAVDTWGETALIKAAYYKGKQDCCAVLLQHPSVDVNITAKNGETALMKGACGGHKEIVNLLLQHGADINAVSNIGKTALMQGALKGHKEVVNFLLQHGADINAADSSGYTALIKAAHYGKQNCCAVLLQHPSVELNLTSKAGDTALSLAKKRGHSQIVRMIQEASAKHQNDEEKARAEAQLKGEKENAEALIQEQLAKLEAEQAQLEEARKALEEVEKKVQVNGQSNEAEMQTMLESSELDVLAEWLSAVQLSEYYDRLVEVGIRNLGDLEDLDEIILREEVHMTRLHINRFNRSYTKLLGTPEMQNGNLVFLSHFKKEAGIDARF